MKTQKQIEKEIMLCYAFNIKSLIEEIEIRIIKNDKYAANDYLTELQNQANKLKSILN